MKNWPLAARTGRMNPSVIREILKVTEQPHIISFAGGLPAPESFPVEAFNTAYATVMREQPYAALQYAASEGYAPLREWVAQSLPWSVSPDQVLITTGSQQALDLVGKVFIDEGSRIAVQTPSYLGALQAFSIYGPTVCSIPNDPDSGEMQLDILEREQLHHAARFLYLLPNFQNPTGQTLSAEMREPIMSRAEETSWPRSRSWSSRVIPPWLSSLASEDVRFSMASASVVARLSSASVRPLVRASMT